ncbi:MAG: hypothetical protein LBS27_02710 [Bifidobacteriaceae bacterium]|nr:hypothetical protein [Bifidobacteriaceae bacterium]
MTATRPAGPPGAGLRPPAVCQVAAYAWPLGLDADGAMVFPSLAFAHHCSDKLWSWEGPVWHPADARFAKVAAGGSGLAGLGLDGRVYYRPNQDWAGPRPPGVTEGGTVAGLLAFPPDAELVDVAVGWDFVVAADADGRVHMMLIRRRRLGSRHLAETAEYRQAPTPSGAPIVAVSAGDVHWAVLDADGRVHTAGGNQYGQLGDGTKQPRPHPAPALCFPDDDPAVEVHAAAAHTSIVTASGRVFQTGAVTAHWKRNPPVMGGPEAGQPGFPRGTRITTMSSGETHMLALDQDQTVWAWGDNSAHQLGCDAQIRWSPRPRPVVGLPRDRQVKQLAAGKRYSIALADDGSACAWGWNEEGHLGVNSPHDYQRHPAKIHWAQ